MKYTCLTIDSIRLMAEGASLPEPSIEVAAAISEDTATRLRQIITKASKFMRHSNRSKLTCADINRALKWSDCQPVFGYECNGNERVRYSYLTEARVFIYENDIVNLEQKYKSQPKAESTLNDDMQDEALPSLSISDIN